VAQAAFVASVMPGSTVPVLFAQPYATCKAETASIMLLTTFGMLLTPPAALL
jgi:malonate transporter